MKFILGPVLHIFCNSKQLHATQVFPISIALKLGRQKSGKKKIERKSKSHCPRCQKHLSKQFDHSYVQRCFSAPFLD